MPKRKSANRKKRAAGKGGNGRKQPGHHRDIVLRGVRQNNLKGFDLRLPAGKLIVVTGPSGSGKSSLAFQTVYAEGQRRYIETFSPYTRQFFDRMDKPLVDEVSGIPPAIAIEQGNAVRTTRSTVGTLTEINDYLKLVFPRLATAVCPECESEVRPDKPEDAIAYAIEHLSGQTVLVGFHVPVPKESSQEELFGFLHSQGYLRVYISGEIVRTDEPAPHCGAIDGKVLVIQDRIKSSGGAKTRARLAEAVELSLTRGKGKLTLIETKNGGEHVFSRGWHCAACDLDIRAPSPGLFSFNNPLGACPDCRGFGRTLGIDLARAIPDHSLSIEQGAIKAFHGKRGRECQEDLLRCAATRGVDCFMPFGRLSKADQKWVLFGDKGDAEQNWHKGRWYGVQGFFDWLETKAYKMHVRVFLSRYRSYSTCRACHGSRLQPEALNYRINNKTLPDLWDLPVAQLVDEVVQLRRDQSKLDPTTSLVLGEIENRLSYLIRVGLSYLQLDRSARSLSGGELQRVHMTTCLGSSLVNTLFVLDEPSIGLHPRDTGRLIEIMENLRDTGNTVLVVEHEESVIRAADHLVDIGPGRGDKGGELVYEGPPMTSPVKGSLTSEYLTGKLEIKVPGKRRKAKRGSMLRISGAQQNNLKGFNVDIPLGCMVCVTGVSGSGKSTLLHDVVYRNLMHARGEISDEPPGQVRSIRGAEKIGEIVMVDQSPLSRTPRSTPVVYVGAFEQVRALFADTPDARAAGYKPGYFSFNSGPGRCGRCSGNGFEKVEMQFLSDLYVRCPECEGKRYSQPALEIRLDNKSIHDILELTVEAAVAFFAGREDRKSRKVVKALEPLAEVGLGYLKLGQPLNTLSGGESQRLKLVAHLLEPKSKKGSRPKCSDLLLFDEPTTGLHFDDIGMLLNVFQRLVDSGKSVIVIEHNTDVIKCADHVIDLGPEGGELGGEIVAAGTPEELVLERNSHTGAWLKNALGAKARPPAKRIPKRVDCPDTGRPVAGPAATICGTDINVHGARENNLKDINVSIPRDAMTVVTGLSGSGKSTLAFDIVFAEGQRRFLDSMSAYARQFVQQLEKPEVDAVSGLPPTVAIEQRVSRGGGKSTVATVTEVYHFLRLLFAKAGTQYCPDCGIAVEKQSITSIVAGIRALLKKGPVHLMAPLIRARKGFHTDVAQWAQRQGIATLFVDGEFKSSSNFAKLERFSEHSIDAVVGDFTKVSKAADITAAVTIALKYGRGTARLLDGEGEITILSSEMSCPQCATAFDELDPRIFSYNSPHGWCPTCRGYGHIVRHRSGDRQQHDSISAAEIDEEARLTRMPDEPKTPCLSCEGSRLNPVARSVWIEESSICSIGLMPVSEARHVISGFTFSGARAVITRDIIKEIDQRLAFLEKVGLGYLELDRSATTLSGGESQRIRLAAQLGSNLCGVLYVLDEPTIGLHSRDRKKLLDTLVALREQGNSLVIVEHDEATIRRADHLIDLGPGAGKSGGEVVYKGKVRTSAGRQVSGKSPTLRALCKPLVHPLRGLRRKLPAKNSTQDWLRVKGASVNNLKKINVEVPLGRLTVFTGVSGSGKSSLMRGVIKPAVESHLNGNRRKAARVNKTWKSLTGAELIAAVYEVDQTPIGKTSRSTPATYVKIFDEVRKLFAAVPEARLRGFDPSRFSFNTSDGRCETCLGNGRIKLEMNFLPTTWIECGDCLGARYNPATLEIVYNGKNIAEVMEMGIEEARDFFRAHPKIHPTLKLLCDSGLGYLSLGQPSPTLSGGEAQRIKLIAEIRKGQSRARNARLKGTGKGTMNLYLIEEPTIGLHQADVQNLIDILHALVDEGHTVIVIEHGNEIIAEADYVIDIGPEAGDQGGKVVAKGTPEQVALCQESRTAPFLREVLA
ncbi:MAG: excinuclease ABC subunit UvrA [Verrucomicrobiota bacterium]|nr:excinuclease ABC subunit UvrA [Verrucomicrobiota bacterium]